MAKDDPKELKTTCWCERSLVMVPAQDVRDGKTRSCFRKDCNAPS